MSTPLPRKVTNAICRAAKRIASYTSCDVAGMRIIMEEELTPVLATPPSAPFVLGRLENGSRPAAVHRLIECRHKVNATNGCTACWSCAKCGKTGCSNMLDWREGDSLIRETCPRSNEQP